MPIHTTKKITYYLGAGASFNALPIVESTKEGLRYAKAYIGSIAAHDSEIPIQLIKDLNWLANTHEKYYSVDTAAKVFYHRHGAKSQELRRLKRALSFYFMLEQNETVQDEYHNFKKERARQINKNRSPLPHLFKEPIDNRYFRLIAYFLGSDNPPQLPGGVNFISWNYDSQLELAYHHFLGGKLDECSKQIGSLPRSSKNAGSQEELETGKIFHLNGVAGHIKDKSTLINLSNHVKGGNLLETKKSLTSQYDHFQQVEEDLLSFAWEDDAPSRELVSRATEIMRETEILVVIGYSFPNFNRTIDRQLIEAFMSNNRIKDKKVYFQDPDPERAKAMNSLFGLEATPYTRVDEFFIPPDV